jgi:hypothetical protein
MDSPVKYCSLSVAVTIQASSANAGSADNVTKATKSSSLTLKLAVHVAVLYLIISYDFYLFLLSNQNACVPVVARIIALDNAVALDSE